LSDTITFSLGLCLIRVLFLFIFLSLFICLFYDQTVDRFTMSPVLRQTIFPFLFLLRDALCTENYVFVSSCLFYDCIFFSFLFPDWWCMWWYDILFLGWLLSHLPSFLFLFMFSFVYNETTLQVSWLYGFNTKSKKRVGPHTNASFVQRSGLFATDTFVRLLIGNNLATT
jgi:hypothetical protein